jgi:hypothetical protein
MRSHASFLAAGLGSSWRQSNQRLATTGHAMLQKRHTSFGSNCSKTRYHQHPGNQGSAELPATIFITSDAVEFFSQSAPATVLRNHPGTFHVWRIMAHVLIMAAFQLRHPVTFFIQMKSSDLSLRVASHHLRLPYG